jgi:serine protease Do
LSLNWRPRSRCRPVSGHLALPALVTVVLLTTVAHAGTVSEKVTRRSAVVRVVEEVKDAVVNISTTQLALRRDPFFEEFFGSFFEPRQRVESRASLGSGIVVDPAGLVVTNAHVVAGAHRVFVGLEGEDDATVPAELLGVDAKADLAVLRITAGRKLPWIDLNAGNPAMIGETVIAIGNPFGLSHTVTVGVVSALDRSIRTNDAVYHRFLQTDASINPGNSGGPLLNVAGELVGINTAIYARGEGIGFAIPRERVQRVVQALTTGDQVPPAWAGWLLADGHGDVTVVYVTPGSPCQLGRVAVHAVEDVFAVLAGSLPSEDLEVRLERGRKRRTSTLRLGEYTADLADRVAQTLLGITVVDWRQPGGRIGGTVVQRVVMGGWAERAGLRPGDLIRELGQIPLNRKADFDEALGSVFNQRSLPLVVERDDVPYLLRLQW